MMAAGSYSNHINEINHRLSNNIEDLLEELGIDFTDFGTRYQFACPIHGGDNDSGATIYTSGVWRCFTNSCHHDFIGLIGFIRGSLQISMGRAIEWAEKFLEGERSAKPSLFFDEDKSERRRYELSREYVRRSLIIPSPYFLRRGFSASILNRYDVGDCNKANVLMSNRAVFPVYTTEMKCIGCVGRIIIDQCKRCNKFHNGECSNISLPKWKNDLDSGYHLFNYWYAHEFFEETETVILVEGQGDVLKLVDAGVNNVVGMFSNTLTSSQKDILFSSPIKNVIILTDSDEAGKAGRAKLNKELELYYNIKNVEIDGKKDVGEMSVDEIMDVVVPKLRSIR